MTRRKDDNTVVIKKVNEETGEESMIIRHKDHKKPTNRRDFLATGMIGMSGLIVAPSILNVLARPNFAYGAEDGSCASSATGMPAFITVNLSGGASISSNMPPLDVDRQPLPKYDLLRLGPDQSVFTDDTKGKTMFQGVRVAYSATMPIGGIWKGIMLRASQATIDKTSLVAINVSSNDDTSSNMHDASGMIMAAGNTGELLPNLGQRNGTGTGVSQTSAIIKSPAALIVNNYTDVAGALAPAGTLAARLTDSRRKKLLELVNSLSGSQARAIATAGSATGSTLARVVECGTGKNIQLSDSKPDINPGLNPAVATVWGINPNTTNSAMYAPATIAYCALNGNASTGAVEIGGCDYHGAGAANQDATDQRAGELIGRIMETASILGKTVMIHVVSDGSVSSNGGDAYAAQGTNDSGSRGTNLMIVFNPNGRPKMKNDSFKHQIGSFLKGQGASDQTPVATPTKAAAAVVANYLHIAGVPDKLDAVAPGIFQRSELDEVIRFA
ncbi:hypothetical protein BH10BDE1_BH10BDE1_24190 [soil metagenome]